MELRLQRIGSLAPAHRAPRQARQHRAIFVTLRRFRTRAEQGTPKTQLQGEQTQVLKRSMFPKDFLFGCATSAYQARRKRLVPGVGSDASPILACTPEYASYASPQVE